MKMNRLRGAACAALLAAMVSACGGGGKTDLAGTDGGDEGATMNAAAPNRPSGQPQGTADAESIDCRSLAAPSGADVVGVSLGMRAEDAYKAVACSNRALRVTYDAGGFQVPAMPDGSRPRTMVLGQRSGEKIEVSLAGLPGQETVVAIRREVTYGQGQEPQMAALAQQLRGKYGELTAAEGFGAGNYHATLIREQPRQPGEIRNPCEPPTHGPMEIYPYCGPSVAVHVDANPSNPQLAAHLIVSLSDGMTGMRLLNEYRAHAQAAAQRQQNQEAGQAAGRNPTL
ncbi:MULTISPECIES: hypothetical protein [unclassified Sphingomonas]|uniref:hypothetical protein n=1 Tax=Sphingomonas TaxID=13687 RepID=UPI001AD51B2B|nr:MULTISPECIES: hypothetical protein [unclassified Sphingomonas]MBN8813451.1 hypothetical protein [Sphingomonas sp.]